jgi:hypothetical protein
LRTDDPGTPGDGRWELNFAFTFERSAGRRELEAPLLDLNYGLGERLQLKYEVPWVHLDEPGSGTSDGLGNSTAGVKWRFVDARGSAPALSCYPQLEFQNPGSSSSERGLAEPGSALFLPLEVAWEFGEYGLGVEVGREFRDVGADGWAAGVALGTLARRVLRALGRGARRGQRAVDSSAGVLDFGARDRPGERLPAARRGRVRPVVAGTASARTSPPTRTAARNLSAGKRPKPRAGITILPDEPAPVLPLPRRAAPARRRRVLWLLFRGRAERDLYAPVALETVPPQASGRERARGAAGTGVLGSAGARALGVPVGVRLSGPGRLEGRVIDRETGLGVP